MNPDECMLYIEQVIVNDYKFRRDGLRYVEYAVGVRNYAKREHFEHDHYNSHVIDTYWRQGAGINLVVCGYITQEFVLLELREVAYFKYT